MSDRFHEFAQDSGNLAGKIGNAKHGVGCGPKGIDHAAYRMQTRKNNKSIPKMAKANSKTAK